MKLTRRRFGAISAAAVAIAAIPLPVGSERRPKIGTAFWSSAYYFQATSRDDALRQAAHASAMAMWRAEQVFGIRLGDRMHDATWHGDMAAWFVATEATVVGYA